MKRMLFLSVVTFVMVLFAVPTLARAQGKEKDQRLTFSVEGIDCAQCAKVMTETMQGTELKVVGKILPNTKGPSKVVATCPGECDLGSIAAKVNKAETPHRDKQPPSFALLLFADLNDDSAQTALAVCRKIEGIDGAKCEADAKSGQIQLRISGLKKVTCPQIRAAFKDAQIQVRTQEKAS